MRAISREAEEIQHLAGTPEVDLAALLRDCQGCNPDGNEAILTERQTEPGMGSNFEREPAVVSSVNELVPRWPAQRNAAQHEGLAL